MKAAQITQFGNIDVIKIVEIEKPKPKDDQVLVKVFAASLNPFDTMVREGKASFPVQLPITLGGDIAGEIVEVGNDVTGFNVGDKVYGQASAVAGNSGAFAEFAATKSSQIALMPKNLGFAEAATMPLVGCSAVQGMDEHINLQAGQKILIQGASGGIGSIALQIAKNIGAFVAATTPPEAIETVKSLGADVVIDYKSQDFTEIVHNYDAVFDTVGAAVFDKSISCLKPGGVAASMTAHANDELVAKQKVSAFTQLTKVTTERLNQLTKLIEDGVVTTRIGKVLPLEQTQEAFKLRESGTLGKIILEINKS